MHLQEIKLINFRNYEALRLEFPSRFNVLVGLNGGGKTNLLDAIYYLSGTRSFQSNADSQNIRYGTDFFSIRGKFVMKDAVHEILCQVQAERKKVFQEDGIDYDRLSDHIGKYPVVLISPADIDLVKESSEARRRFFDQMISVVDHTYLENLMVYQHALKQRNALLKLIAERGFGDETLLESYNMQLAERGNLIYIRRRVFTEEYLPYFNQCYRHLAGVEENARLTYRSALHETTFSEGLAGSYRKDLALERTTFGVHRDDFHFEFAHGELKKLGSQGQQKSFLVAIKLAQVEIIGNYDGFSPIMLLDDIFDKLDDERIERLVASVTRNNQGQLFITDARPERTRSLLKALAVEAQLFKVEQGKINVW